MSGCIRSRKEIVCGFSGKMLDKLTSKNCGFVLSKLFTEIACKIALL